jgi:hypothetical protein
LGFLDNTTTAIGESGVHKIYGPENDFALSSQ